MRVGIIASSLALRAGIRSLLGEGGSTRPGLPAEANFEVVFEAHSLSEPIQTTPEMDVLVIADQAADQPELLRLLPEEDIRLAILLLSDDPQQAQMLAGLPLRGWGVLPMDSSAEELRAGLWAVNEGLVVGRQQVFAPALARSQLTGGQEMDPMYASLTERENQVLQLLARGLANKQIALALSISEHTVKFHISSIYAKLGTNNRTEAVRAGIQRGLVAL